MSNLFDKTTQALQTSVDLRQLRHQVTSANIANAETPGYRAQKVDFEDALSRSLDIDGLRGMSADHEDHYKLGSKGKVRADVYDNPEIAVNNDKNTVDLEKEISRLSENTILYKAALTLMNKKLAALRYAASDGR